MRFRETEFVSIGGLLPGLEFDDGCFCVQKSAPC